MVSADASLRVTTCHFVPYFVVSAKLHFVSYFEFLTEKTGCSVKH